MLEIYIKYFDNNYYLLDLKDSESVNLKTIYKDLNDITKIFSPYTPSFKIPATDKNKMLVDFLGNEKTLNFGFDFDAKIYVFGFLFQTGKLSFSDFDYEQNEQKELTATFGSTISGLVELLGDSTIQDLFKNQDGSFDKALRISWNVNTVKNYLQKITNTTLENGINLSFGVPFISNIRTWIYEDNLAVVDNIKYNQFRSDVSENFIKLGEVRPAISYPTILKQLFEKYNLNVICPILERPEVAELFASCNSESLVVAEQKAFPLNYFENVLTNTRYDTEDNISGVALPGLGFERWKTSLTAANGVFKVKRNESANYIYNWGDGFDLKIKFNDLISLESQPTKIKVNLLDADSGIILQSVVVENSNEHYFPILDNFFIKSFSLSSGFEYGFETQLNANGEISLKLEILPENLVSWSSIEAGVFQNFKKEKDVAVGGNKVAAAKFKSVANNFTKSEDLGGDKLNLITTLPKIKTIDFLKSFLKTFNISIIPTGREDNEMYWVTPSDILEVNKEYSKRLVDYTLFTDNKSLPKKKANQYNQYLFTHKKSKYYESLYGDGTYFGSLVYPTITPSKPTKFEVATDYSILKQSNFTLFNNIRTCFAFEKEGATVQDNGGNRYKPVFEEFTIFYLKYKSLGSQRLSFEFSNINNWNIKGVLEANFVNYTNGKSLAFGAENAITDSLYLNYYKDLIERLLNPNAFASTFNLNLPSNEIFLNFSNQEQGQSNIPTGFRPQNDIIIAEQRYSLIDSAIDLTKGKTKLTLLNY